MKLQIIIYKVYKTEVALIILKFYCKQVKILKSNNKILFLFGC